MIATFLLTAICFGFAILIPNVGDATTILGATTNSGVGFVLPCLYYLKLKRKEPTFSSDKIPCYATIIIISICSVIELGTFIYKKVHP